MALASSSWPRARRAPAEASLESARATARSRSTRRTMRRVVDDVEAMLILGSSPKEAAREAPRASPPRVRSLHERGARLSCPRGVHVVYGRNEAGKSTALRAITGLLYGIAQNTPDAHVHKMPDLRVGRTGPRSGRRRARTSCGARGRTNTLLDREVQPSTRRCSARCSAACRKSSSDDVRARPREPAPRRRGTSPGRGERRRKPLRRGRRRRRASPVCAPCARRPRPCSRRRPHPRAERGAQGLDRRAPPPRDESMSPESMFEQRRTWPISDAKRPSATTSVSACWSKRRRLQRACQALPVVAKRKLVEEQRAAIRATW